jgi:hypothetical protein
VGITVRNEFPTGIYSYGTLFLTGVSGDPRETIFYIQLVARKKCTQ